MKSVLLKVYELMMIVLVFIVLTILIIEFTFDLNDTTSRLLSIIDFIILMLFTVDYVIRLFMSKDKYFFIRTNKADLVAIIPFSSFFRVFRLARIARLARLSRINRVIRIGVWLTRFKEKIHLFIKTNGFIYMIIITIIMILAGAIGGYLLEGMSISDGIWWSFVTTTTVGYGDISPESIGGRILAGLLMLIGIGFIGMLTGTIATFFINGIDKPKPYKKEALDRIKNKLDNFDDLSEDEIRDMFKVLITLKKDEIQL
ncbi:potassium channel family protein [Amphibacillus cookii]|uniref:potassium channel family protein n=1 Tax=Amphibacillus cookii TaxID=767787 RepID=UPI00195B4789|nr:potassium channel family protein [Amphibacillus cookii]MBM7540194.1 voltage-gated potassium channel [Amphibacillus cookii]